MIAGLLNYWIMLLAGLVALGIQLWAMVDCLIAKPSEFERADKRNKGFWTAITVVAAFVGAINLLSRGLGFFFILAVVACVAAGVYLADVRPALRLVRRGGGRPMGPYGPW
ncbi:DUF2516 family protein [Psychromicrobium lacuslunae]|uniref:DUF2516 family protein n=1 Tax=Psychromicrobium lacuslunae TaxID=1618207 RepID=UPI000A4C2CC8|nr:DUF2516 family protein [Psychromicrobium lacuslunae]